MTKLCLCRFVQRQIGACTQELVTNPVQELQAISTEGQHAGAEEQVKAEEDEKKDEAEWAAAIGEVHTPRSEAYT